MSQTERLYWLDAQIRAGRYPNPHSLSQRFEVSLRTAHSDRAYLVNRLQAPLAFDRHWKGWYYTDPTWVLPFLALSEQEAGTLRRTLLAAQEYLPPTDSESLRGVADKLTAYLSPVNNAHERVSGGVHLTQSLAPALAADCERALRHRYRMRLLYYSVRRDETTERIVRPYNLLLWRGEPHLIAFCEWRQDIRQFFLGRIRDWYVLENESSFVPDPAFDIDEYLGRGLDLQHGAEAVTVRCRFSPYQARWIRERTYHASKTIEEQADGSLILSLEVAGTEEVRRWLLGYGAEVEILEPPALRRAMADEAKKLQKIYADFAE